MWALKQLANEAFRINLMPQVQSIFAHVIEYRISLLLARTEQENDSNLGPSSQ